MAAGPGAYHLVLSVTAMCAMSDWASGVGGAHVTFLSMAMFAMNAGRKSRDLTIGNEGLLK
ncbi:MAG: hypothetical protein QF535_24000 [Anaerolineales bacterium]|nr:hypothetical protein [Anaerolineales bacterium]